MKPERFKSIAAPRDATANIKPKGARGYKDGEVEALQSTSDYWKSPDMLRQLTSDEKVPYSSRASAVLGALDRSDSASVRIPDAERRESAALKTKEDLGLENPANEEGEMSDNLFRGRSRGSSKRRVLDDHFSKGEPGDGLEREKALKKGRDPRSAATRQGENRSNKKIGRADDVDAPVKGDGSPHYQR